VADLVTAVMPDEPTGADSLRHSWAHYAIDNHFENHVIEEDSTPVGHTWLRHPPWDQQPSRECRIGVEILPDRMCDQLFGEAYGQIESAAAREEAHTLYTYARETETEVLAYLESHGYSEERRSRWWELDLVGNRERLLTMYEVSKRRMVGAGIELSTLDREDDPERYRRLYRLEVDGAADVPTTVPYVPASFEAYMDEITGVGVFPDRVWIAKDGPVYVGTSMLEYPPTRGNVWTSWTTTARAARGLGIARALKLATVAQAIELDVPSVRTDNDYENAPILHINEQLGYQRIPGEIELRRSL
jgi:GNAT superfamily N-acetyltransferase